MAQSLYLQLVFNSALAYFVPPLLIRFALSCLYRLFPRLRRSPQHAQLAHSAIVLLYITYTITTCYAGLPTNYYDLLGVTPVTGDPAIWKDTILRPRWLTIVKVYHPDKVGGSAEAQEYFRQLQNANEVLKTDSHRQAYERFGSDFLKSLPLADSTLTERDIFARGVMLNVGYHVLTVLIVVIIPILTGRSKKRFFWRLSSLVLLLSNELAILSSTRTCYALLSHPLLTSELVTLFRQLWFSFEFALNHLPFFSSDATTKPDDIATRIGPLIGALSVRNEISSRTLDKLVKREVGKQGHSREEMVNKVIKEMRQA